MVERKSYRQKDRHQRRNTGVKRKEKKQMIERGETRARDREGENVISI